MVMMMLLKKGGSIAVSTQDQLDKAGQRLLTGGKFTAQLLHWTLCLTLYLKIHSGEKLMLNCTAVADGVNITALLFSVRKL